MNVWKARSATKSNIRLGTWRDGKMPRTAFPMSRSRSKAYRLGAGWRWRVVEFDANGMEYRLLIAYRTDKEQYMARLGVNDDGDMKIVASLEFHGTHPRWHLHYPKENMSKVPSGVMRGPWVKRKNCVGKMAYGLNGLSWPMKGRLSRIAANVFGIRLADNGVKEVWYDAATLRGILRYVYLYCTVASWFGNGCDPTARTSDLLRVYETKSDRGV